MKNHVVASTFIVIILAFLCNFTIGHGGLTTPSGIRRNQKDMDPMCLEEGKGPLVNFKLPLQQSCPLDGDGYYRMCRGIQRGNPSVTYRKGETVNMEYTFFADHTRGACSVSILEQRGDEYFMVAKDIWTEGTFCAYQEDCPDSQMTCGSNTDAETKFPFQVTIPENIDCTNCVLLWQWRVDSRGPGFTNFQWYDNCLDFTLEGSSGNGNQNLPPVYPDYPGSNNYGSNLNTSLSITSKATTDSTTTSETYQSTSTASTTTSETYQSTSTASTTTAETYQSTSKTSTTTSETYQSSTPTAKVKKCKSKKHHY